MVKLFMVSSLQKVFPDEENFAEQTEGECFADEVFFFQLVMVPDFSGEAVLSVKTDLSLRLFVQKFVMAQPRFPASPMKAQCHQHAADYQIHRHGIPGAWQAQVQHFNKEQRCR